MWKDKIPFNLYLGLFSLLLLVILSQLNIPGYYSVVLIPYSVLCIAFTPLLPFHKVAKYGDFSYGLYIYAFPVQQTLVYYFLGDLNELTFLISASIITLVFAYFSWHYIEKPCMNLKKKLFN